jgi:hypothetical protein
VVVGILLVQAIWNLTATAYLLRGVKLAANPSLVNPRPEPYRISFDRQLIGSCQQMLTSTSLH